MAELSGEHLIEVRVGEGKPPIVRVRPGETIGPMSVGTEGAWQIEAPGVSREHAEIYFDGKELFARSLSAVVPVLLGAKPVPNAWTALAPPCELLLGEARIWFGPDIGVSKHEPAQMEELLEDDDNVATSVAEPPQRPWGDVGALVQRGIETSRAKAQGGDVWPPEPQGPPGPFWPPPAALPPPGGGADPFSADGPSASRKTENSAMTRVDQQVPTPATPSPWGAPAAAADGRQTLHEVGGMGATAVLPNSPLPAPSFTASSPAGGIPVPTFGPPPSAPSFTASSPAGGIPAPSFTASSPAGGIPAPSFTASSPAGGIPAPSFTASSPAGGIPAPSTTSSLSIPGGMPPLGSTTGMEQPASIPGLERNEPNGKKSAWREMSPPRRILILISPLLVLAVVIIFMDKELGLVPPPRPRRPAATAKPSAKPSAAPATSAQEAPSEASSEAPPEPAVVSSADEPPPKSAHTSSRGSMPTATNPKTRTLQRQAADAVAQGAYLQAAEFYDQLAKENPKQPAYAEAATIMRAKATRRQ